MQKLGQNHTHEWCNQKPEDIIKAQSYKYAAIMLKAYY